MVLQYMYKYKNYTNTLLINTSLNLYTKQYIKGYIYFSMLYIDVLFNIITFSEDII